MKNYQIQEIENETIISYESNGKRISFATTDPANSDYAEYLRYTEWVAAGNDPEEFWSN